MANVESGLRGSARRMRQSRTDIDDSVSRAPVVSKGFDGQGNASDTLVLCDVLRVGMGMGMGHDSGKEINNSLTYA